MKARTYPLTKEVISIRGGGDLATGVIQKLVHAGYRVLVHEIERPTAIRTEVALSSCMFKGEFQVEDIVGRKVSSSKDEVEQCWKEGIVPCIVDEDASFINVIKPSIVVDAILAKRNVGTTIDMADIVIGMGPGFEAKKDVDVVIETMRGHTLGRVLAKGSATPNTGIPGNIGGKTAERVLRAPKQGTMKHIHKLGDVIEEGKPVFEVDGDIVLAPFTGTLRGLLPEGMSVFEGMKVADMDPRDLREDACFTISDKARALGGAVLDAIEMLKYEQSL